VTTFGDTNLASKLASMKFFLMVDIEGTLAGWDATSQGILKSFVQNGGTMVMTGTYGTNDDNFLNDAFGWDLSDSPCVEVPISDMNTVGTPWEGTWRVQVLHSTSVVTAYLARQYGELKRALPSSCCHMALVE